MKKVNVLLVENDDDERSFMTKGFEASGLFNVIKDLDRVEDVLSYLQQHDAESPDIIISDYSMPRKNGLEFFRESKDAPALAGVKRMLISTTLSPDLIEGCKAIGCYYKEKPSTFLEYQQFASQVHKDVFGKD